MQKTWLGDFGEILGQGVVWQDAVLYVDDFFQGVSEIVQAAFGHFEFVLLYYGRIILNCHRFLPAPRHVYKHIISAIGVPIIPRLSTRPPLITSGFPISTVPLRRLLAGVIRIHIFLIVIIDPESLPGLRNFHPGIQVFLVAHVHEQLPRLIISFH